MLDEDRKIVVSVLMLVDVVGELEVPGIALILRLVDPTVTSL